jgi:hypothetical protein
VRVRRTPTAALAAGAALVVSVLAGCSSPSGPSASAPVPRQGTTAASPSPASTASLATTASATPRSASPAQPARTSGPLSVTSLPGARVLGPGWVTRVDPGSGEGDSNGTPVQAVGPQGVVAGMRPLGCASDAVYATRLPMPEHALEVTYAHPADGRSGLGLVLQFGDEATARRFETVYTDALRACTAGPGGTTTVSVVPSPPGTFASVQVDTVEDTVWRELVVRDGGVLRSISVEGRRTPTRSWSAIAAELPGR